VANSRALQARSGIIHAMKTWMVALVISLAACGGKPPPAKPTEPVAIKPVEVQPAAKTEQSASQILTLFDGMKQEMCACAADDAKCGQAVIEKLSKAAKGMTKNPKMSPDEQKRAMDISTGFTECMGRVMRHATFNNPCGGNPCGGNPCGGNPCGGDVCGDPCDPCAGP
jgi:predicted small lipoprotein YifL